MTADGRPLRDSLEDYLALRRALGFRLKTAGRLLGQFVELPRRPRCRHDHHRRRP